MEEPNRDLKRPWDTCREVPVIEDEHTPWKLLKFLKIIALFAVAIIVFGLAICSKASFLLLITLSHEDTKTLQAEQKPVALLCIGCSLIAPTVLVLLKSIWKACYKSSKLPRKSSVALVLFFEFLVSVGLAVLTIVAMPHLDIVTNVAILNSVAVLSGFLQAVAQCTVKRMNIFLLPSIVAFVVMVVGYCLFLVLYMMKDPADVKTAVWVGLAVGGSILVSFNWWENYFRVVCVKSKSNILKNLFEDLNKSQNMLHIMSSLLRIVVTACVLGAYVPLAQMDWDIVTSIPSRETRIIAIIIGVQLISSALCHWFALAACKMHAVRRCFIVPLYLASLAVMVLFIVPVILDYQDHQLNLNTTENINFTSYCAEAVNVRNQSLSGNLFPHLVLDVTQTLCFLDMSNTADIGLLTGAAASWWIGLVLVTIHIWYFNINRIQKTQDLFGRRLYEGAFIEQSLLLNTRFNIRTRKSKKKQNKEDDIPAMIYLCATMWHETYEEMMNIMISMFRLDKYRPKAGSKFNDFTFEAHLFFDDAFENAQETQDRHLNTYAKDLVQIITEVHGIFKNLDKTFFEIQQEIPHQSIIETPYGARLVVEMPHGNNIVVHFKDKQKIRNKKRWSQVMYLYYLLGWKLMTKYHTDWKKGENETDLKIKIKREKHNTYLLALDGDTDFQPAALLLLIDRLKMYPRVGAACGRIHPTGSGPAVWFQKFEYAVSHWLQKTAEHVFGCVLCSPGCFSLFRAEALMDDNVMKKYSTKSTEPSQYIQYDQGEDRWLCTLLLKQGWRVEYNAASDAYTNAPQEFKELYNQRKRWGPSTMANVVDLLGSTNLVSKKNPSMSKPFMLYQLFAMISAILAPATICFMVAGSLSFILNISSAAALVLAVIPPAIYLGLCFKLKADTQITIAAVLSIMYAFLMLVVTMSIIASMVKEKTILTPSSIFIVAMSIIYIVTALLHPQELPLLFYGLLYIICIPSAYLLLTIYSMVNMNSVSWGTRETKPAAEAASTAATIQQTKSQKVKSTFKRLCSQMKCCKKSHERLQEEQLTMSQEIPEPIQVEPQPQNSIVDDSPQNEQQEEETRFYTPAQCWKAQVESLSSDIQLQVDSLDEDEDQFWKELIEKYLEPLQNDKEKQEKTKNELQDLRNKINFSFFFLNALWLVAAFVFQLFDVFQLEFDIVDLNLKKTGKKFQVEPMSLMFILGFAISVLLQFIGMLYHRIMTLIHYVAFLETEPKQQKSAKTESDSRSDADDSSLFQSVTDMSNISQDESEFDLSDESDNENIYLGDIGDGTQET
ncbi:chitin synthase chs-2-like [Poeciliopsis prolifica]|uniref:chitin synthase chs-2-like n=1 Tax=Poeciliopsis prolifica TaxID=188132 RepID=UPI002414247B|nr:chitin synthase chs-2-like [Poeciliopsis prolifica]